MSKADDDDDNLGCKHNIIYEESYVRQVELSVVSQH